ncbi:hypothetical protein ONZ45_g905 [Pleurotus djamor]|nr:hypothetical protein ONZ45_g905 [Pleurotus djamor]
MSPLEALDTFVSHIATGASIPSELFSLPSRQRHHFLRIDPDNVHDYLAWPTETSAAAVDRLIEYAASQPFAHSVDVAYSGPYAHCHLRTTSTPAIRLVFLWDPSATRWHFHTVDQMPFPQGTSSTSTMSPHFQFLHEEPLVDPRNDAADADDAAYWDAYGQSHDDADQDPNSIHIAADPKLDDRSASEDAYWARYAAVQGSADSTQPSPLPGKRNKSNHLPTDPTNPHLQPHSRNESFPSLTHLHPLSKQTQDYPSPHVLTERLIAISARPAISPLDDLEESPTSTSIDTLQNPDILLDTVTDTMDSDSDSTSPSPPPGLVKLGVKSAGSPERRLPVDLSVVTASSTSPPFQNLGSSPDVVPKEMQFAPEGSSHPGPGDEGKEALKESIRGVYRLWKASRLPHPPNSGNSGSLKASEKDVFMDLVRQAIQEC